MIKRAFFILCVLLLATPAYAAITRVQSQTNGVSTTSPPSTNTVTITAATAGNLLVSAIGIDKSSGAITVPTGFTLINDYESANVSGAFAYKVSTGGETSITWSWVTGRGSSAWVGEYSGTSSAPLDASAEADSGASAVTSQVTGTTAATVQANEQAIAFATCDSFGACNGGRSWSNSYVELVFVGSLDSEPGLSIAELTLTSIGTTSSTYSVVDTGDQMYAGVATFKESLRKVIMVS